MDEIPLAPAPLAPKLRPTSPAAKSPPPAVPPRRGFFGKVLAVVIGSLVGVVPVASGLAVFLDPLRRRQGLHEPIRVATLDALPDDGMPRLFPVIADRDDAWTRYVNQPVGAVYLRRLPGSSTVQALSATCPHAGCFVELKEERKQFQCPCHTSAFQLDGHRVMPCVAPRGMDELKCEVVTRDKEQQVLVYYLNYYSGLAEKKPKA
ncbi:MAG TPA: Rieske 2Fe-2S domain-containing protein [Pirellulales bacterium]